MYTLLIAEDDHAYALILEHFLLSLGHKVLIANNGEQAVEMFKIHQPDLIFMDVLMPAMDGHQATREIRRLTLGDPVQVPILFLTAIESEKVLAECLECGGDDFISKPFSTTTLKARLNAWLKKRHMSEEMARDHRHIARVVENLRRDTRYYGENLRTITCPMAQVSGDLILSAKRHDGTQLIAVVDFTGHGLSAAICGPLISHAFYTHFLAHIETTALLFILNELLCHKLPEGMFMAAHFVELSPDQRQMRLWNFGMPACVHIDGSQIFLYGKHLLPMGIHEMTPQSMVCTVQPINKGSRLYLFSDGVNTLVAYDSESQYMEDIHCFLRACFEEGQTPPLPDQPTLSTGCTAPIKDDITIAEITLTA
ncbi:response regulator receiver protein [Magnetococcus marinus MC-1]|uniref:Response regulator receiver protein n=1 Tax=Magnetococcus marinus (strain ATCC BAA-1437 / JCM 17883 / MC-1) TaxID=156889 RepID=A0LC21_MAGMM|nr:response regulator [Magnetococcus marinus]ABK45514.1 response regulator receiver protein [Magnetococcus marinus MC-1]